MESRFSIALKLKIRQCAREDLPQLDWFGLYTEHRQLIEDAFRRQQAGEVMMLVAALNGFPAGQAWLDLRAQAADSVGVIWALRFPLLRNHGIGTRLMIAAEQLLSERGYRWSELTVDQHEPRPRRLYERLGYRSLGSTVGPLNYTTPEKKVRGADAPAMGSTQATAARRNGLGGFSSEPGIVVQQSTGCTQGTQSKTDLSAAQQ